MSLRHRWLAAVAAVSLLVPAAARADFLFWTATDGVYRANADGSGVTAIVTGESASAPSGIAVDAASGFVYWTDNFSSVDAADIHRANYDGSNRAVLTDYGGSFGLNGIDVDPANSRMVWSTGNAIHRDDASPATGQNIQTVTATNSHGIAIDAAAGKVYWSSLATASIRRANLDGTGLETVVSLSFPAWDLALDLANGFVYWTEPRLQRIARADLDPLTNDATTLLSGASLGGLNGLTLDVANDRMFWVQDNVTNAGSRIFTSTLSGANVQTLITTPVNVNANFISFAPTPAAVPEPSSALLLAAVGLGAVATRRFRRRGENPAEVG